MADSSDKKQINKWNKSKWQRITIMLCCMNLLLGICVISQLVQREDSGTQKLMSVRQLQNQNNVKGKSDEESSTKKIALTFDDGPNPDYTPQILDGLKERNVKATFFLLGEEVETYPEIVKRMYEEGHLIGNHTYDHVNLGHLCEGAACKQVKRTNEIIEEVTGYYPEFVRPPFGEWKENIDKDMTMIKVLWNVDPLDWATSNSDAVVQRVIQKCEDNDIILMHDASASSVKAALEIVDTLQKSGYEFVTVDQLILD